MQIASLDHDVALVFLEESGYNLDAAVNRYFSSFSAPSPVKPSRPPVESMTDDEGYLKLEHVPQPKVMRLVDPPSAAANEELMGYNQFRNNHVASDFSSSWLEPFEKQNAFVLPGSNRKSSSHYNDEPFRDFKQESMYHEGRSGNGKRNGPVKQEGKGNGRPEERRNLASLFRPPFEICFNESYDQALEYGSKCSKYVIVNIQDPKIFECQVLNRDTWADSTLKEYIRRHFIFWQRAKEMAPKYCQYYQPALLPHIALLDPRTGERLGCWEGAIGAKEMLKELKSYLQAHPFEPDTITIEDSLSPMGLATAHTNSNAAPHIKKPKFLVRSLTDLSEQEQMEHAIKESLKEEEDCDPNPKKRKNAPDDSVVLIDSSDDSEEERMKKIRKLDTEIFNLSDSDDASVLSQSDFDQSALDSDEDDESMLSELPMRNQERKSVIFEKKEMPSKLGEKISEVKREATILPLNAFATKGDPVTTENLVNGNNVASLKNEAINLKEPVMDIGGNSASGELNGNRPAELHPKQENPPSEAAPVDCQIKIRLPDGSTMARNFLSDTKLAFLLEMVRREKPASQVLNHDAGGTVEAFKSKLDSEPKYLLRCGHPPVTYTQEQGRNITLAGAGLVPRGIIFVENQL